MKAAGYKKLTGAEQRALAQQLAPTAAPSEATVREGSFLRNIVGAGDDLEWILLNQAWTQLGFERVGDWWEQRVLPVLEKLDVRPSVSLADRVIAAVQADEATLPKVQRRTQREIAAMARTSQSKVSRSLTDARESGSDLEEASAAGPAATTEDASPALGETGPEPAPNGLGSAGPEPDRTGLGSGNPEDLDEEEVPCFECSAPLDPRDAADGYYKCLDCDPERLFRIASDSPAADPMAPPSPQQPGHNSPTGVEGPRSETDSPTGLEAVQPHDDRSETIHQQVAGVSPAGVAPGSCGPQYADPVEPVELEDGDAAVTPSSSDLDVAGNPAERLLLAVAGLVHYLDQVDVDVVGPLLFGPDVEQLFSHAEEISAHITRIGKARFAEMLTP